MTLPLEPWAFIVAALVAYRVTRFFVWDSLAGSNPESGSSWSRRLNGLDGRDGIAYTREGEDRNWWRGKLGDLLVCPYCTGFWVALAVTCLALRSWPWQLDVEGWFAAVAVAGAAALLNTYDRR